MKVKYSNIPLDIRIRYNLEHKVTNDGYLYIKIKKGTYRLQQAAILAYEYLQKTLKPYGCAPVPGTVGLWKHATRPIQFCLCVDNFGVKYFDKVGVRHLQKAIGAIFQYSSDWNGTNFCGIKFDWHYDEQYVDVSMPGYVKKSLQRLQHTPITPQYSPHHYTSFHYGMEGVQQYTSAIDTSPLLSPT